MDILAENFNFTLNKDINGPLLAVAVGIEFTLSLVANLFVLIFTVCHPKTLKQPSIIFLTNFIFANLMVTILIMPLTIITAANEEWIFGNTPEEKNIVCQFGGFVFAYGIQLTLWTLTVISVDRFLFIVKPFIHKRFMTTWVAGLLVLCIWIFSCIINIPPYFGFGQYAFGQFTATCVQVWVGHRGFLVYLCLIVLVVAVAIIVTTIWTFCFTRNFIKRTYLSTSAQTNPTNNDNLHKHLYTSRMRKVIGIFSLLIVITVVSFIPAVLAGIIGIIIGSENLPPPIFSIVIISFWINGIANPIIQSYFRRDVKEFLVNVCRNVMKCFTKQQPKTESETSTSVVSKH